MEHSSSSVGDSGASWFWNITLCKLTATYRKSPPIGRVHLLWRETENLWVPSDVLLSMCCAKRWCQPVICSHWLTGLCSCAVTSDSDNQWPRTLTVNTNVTSKLATALSLNTKLFCVRIFKKATCIITLVIFNVQNAIKWLTIWTFVVCIYFASCVWAKQHLPKYILPYITKKSKEIRLLTKQAKRGLTWSRAQWEARHERRVCCGQICAYFITGVKENKVHWCWRIYTVLEIGTV